MSDLNDKIAKEIFPTLSPETQELVKAVVCEIAEGVKAKRNGAKMAMTERMAVEILIALIRCGYRPVGGKAKLYRDEDLITDAKKRYERKMKSCEMIGNARNRSTYHSEMSLKAERGNTRTQICRSVFYKSADGNIFIKRVKRKV